MTRQVFNAAGEDVLENDLKQQKRKEFIYGTKPLRKGEIKIHTVKVAELQSKGENCSLWFIYSPTLDHSDCSRRMLPS